MRTNLPGALRGGVMVTAMRVGRFVGERTTWSYHARRPRVIHGRRWSPDSYHIVGNRNRAVDQLDAYRIVKAPGGYAAA